jgi:uridine phosphorylase
MPRRLRPTAAIAPEAILVGDPGRALLLAQELLDEPKMSNHARGLWGYSGRNAAGAALTIQATGIGGPSAVVVISDLAKLGVRRMVRVGTCVGLDQGCELGGLLLATAAIAEGGSATPLGVAVGEAVLPDEGLTERVGQALAGTGTWGTVASFDAHPGGQASSPGIIAADMQTAPLLACARSLRVEGAAILIVAEIARGEKRLEEEALQLAEKRAGRAAAAALSS